MRPRSTAQVLVALGIIALAVAIGYQAATIPVSPIYARVGPTVFPIMVAAGTLALGVGLLWQALRGGWAIADQDEAPIDRRAVAWVLLGLVLNVALIKLLGFILASALLFGCVARGFGSRRQVRDGAVGLVVSAAAYVGFDKILGISVGAGWLEGLL